MKGILNPLSESEKQSLYYKAGNHSPLDFKIENHSPLDFKIENHSLLDFKIRIDSLSDFKIGSSLVYSLDLKLCIGSIVRNRTRL